MVKLQLQFQGAVIKEYTFTKNEMTVRVLVTASGRVTFDGSGYAPEGTVRAGHGASIEGPLRVEVEKALAVAERQLAHGKNFLLGDELTIADFYLLPSTFAFSLTAEGQAMYPTFPAFCRWRKRMDNLPATQKVRAGVPRLPIEHAREWANSHRPKY